MSIRLAKLSSASSHHRRAARAGLGPSFVDDCVSGIPPEHVTCALAANDDAALAACLDLEYAQELDDVERSRR